METTNILIESTKNYKTEHKSFEIIGDNMEPHYKAGDVVICKEVQRHLWEKKLNYNDSDFVIVHGIETTMLKEITSHNTMTGEITCRSLNSNEDDFKLNMKDLSGIYSVVELRISQRSRRSLKMK